MCVNGRYNGSAIIKNCQFIGNTNSQGGALTPHNHCIVENCTLINNTATKFYGGANSFFIFFHKLLIYKFIKYEVCFLI